MSNVRVFEVGGMVRDAMLDLPVKDHDFAIEAESFDAMREHLLAQGFTIFLETPEHLNIRARFPETSEQREHSARMRRRARGEKLVTADFVLCRKDGYYTDGRRPDTVEPGTIFDDLARRDFTVNAMARNTKTGGLIDPHGGRDDLNVRQLRCVGSAEDRLHEDSLRALRAIRFAITKDFTWDRELRDVMRSDWLPELLANVSTERRREELARCFAADTISTLEVLHHWVTREFRMAALADLRLMPTMRERNF